jgi:apolipoprotein N-acyltransferase
MDKIQTFTDKLTRSRFAILMLILGAVAAVLSSARFGLGFFAWIWPICVLIFFRQGNLKRKWLWFLPLFIGANIFSTQETVPFPLPVLAVISTLYALILGLIFQLDRWIMRRQDHFLATLFLPAAFVTREYLDAMRGGGIWGSIANSQLGFSWFSQLAAVTGIFGISFMIYCFASVVVCSMGRIGNRHSFK